MKTPELSDVAIVAGLLSLMVGIHVLFGLGWMLIATGVELLVLGVALDFRAR